MCYQKKYKSKIEEKSKIRELLGDINFPLDILVPNLEEYDFYGKEINSVYNEINQKGEVLWSQKNT